MYRKIVLKRIVPNELVYLYESIQIILTLHRKIKKDATMKQYMMKECKIEEICLKLITLIDTTLNIKIAMTISSLSFEENFFNSDISSTLDNKEKNYVESLDILESVRNFLDSVVAKFETKSKKSKKSKKS